MAKPNDNPTKPFSIEWPDSDEIKLRPRTAIAKYSAGPNANAIDASEVAVTISNSVLTIEPNAALRMDNVSAAPASPRSRIGYPSSAVIAAAGIPGVFTRMAGIAPAYSV